VRVAWFRGLVDQLTVVSAAEVRVARRNPFDFVVTEDPALGLPASYVKQADVLEPYRRRGTKHGPVGTLARKLARSAQGRTLPFLAEAAQHLAAFKTIVRDEGPPQSPQVTLVQRKGACRDLTVLYNELCRCQGLAARFVSGYWRGTGGATRRDLHAWSEVYLPGAGWVGFDPSSGFAVTDDHVPLAAACEPRMAAPVDGSFAGQGAAPRMTWTLRVETRTL
jgi:transglutaminase-like putative cysteine protease